MKFTTLEDACEKLRNLSHQIVPPPAEFMEALADAIEAKIQHADEGDTHLTCEVQDLRHRARLLVKENEELLSLIQQNAEELVRRRTSDSVACDLLDEWGVPGNRDGITLIFQQRLVILLAEREGIANQLSAVWIELDRWARDESVSLETVRERSREILTAQEAPGWKREP